MTKYPTYKITFLTEFVSTYSSFHFSSAATVRLVARDSALTPVMAMSNALSVNAQSPQ